jgi:hypothetical protein
VTSSVVTCNFGLLSTAVFKTGSLPQRVNQNFLYYCNNIIVLGENLEVDYKQIKIYIFNKTFLSR